MCRNHFKIYQKQKQNLRIKSKQYSLKLERNIEKGKNKGKIVDFNYYSNKLPIKIRSLKAIQVRKAIYNSIDVNKKGYLSLNELISGMKRYLKFAVFDCK